MNRGYTVEAIMTRCSSLRDKGVSIGFHTKELDPSERAQIMEYDGAKGWLLFKENEIADEEVPQQDAEYEGKTPSQRLRAVLFILYSQQGVQEDFEIWYRSRIERIINSIKNKLE